ncbi:MAG: hypothetical protein OEL66_05975 [Desulfobulbaceae bacterium]|nr:hypothetical protein [Desulfobulbaceae bacterium]
MISQCPHCQKDIKLNEAQQAKIDKALAALAKGKTLKIGCPHCKEPIELSPDEKSDVGGGAVMENLLGTEQENDDSLPPGGNELLEKAKAENNPDVKPPPEAPHPPDVSWLASGELSEKAVVSDIPMALILMKEGAMRDQVVKAFEGRNYMPVFMNSAEEAIEEMRFTDYAAVILQSNYEGANLESSLLHEHMSELGMNKRRYMFYVLVGAEFRTLYDLEALARSANLVVNEKDVKHIDVILTKALRTYDELFGPYLKALKEHGKR